MARGSCPAIALYPHHRLCPQSSTKCWLQAREELACCVFLRVLPLRDTLVVDRAGSRMLGQRKYDDRGLHLHVALPACLVCHMRQDSLPSCSIDSHHDQHCLLHSACFFMPPGFCVRMALLAGSTWCHIILSFSWHSLCLDGYSALCVCVNILWGWWVQGSAALRLVQAGLLSWDSFWLMASSLQQGDTAEDLLGVGGHSIWSWQQCSIDMGHCVRCKA